MPAAILAVAMSVHLAAAAELPFSKAPFTYTVINESLSAALTEFGHDVHLRIVVSDDVAGRVTSRLSATNVREFLDAITLEYGLDWYYDGYAAYVTSNADSSSTIVRLPAAEYPALTAALVRAGVTDSRYSIRPLPGAAGIVVSGPPRFVALVQQTAAAISPSDAPAMSAVENLSLTVFRGNESQRLNFDGREKP